MLEPDTLYLGRTREFTKTDCFVPMLEGRSSVGRLGLFIHVTAGFGDVGFAGYWTLEIFCVQPIRIYAGVEICQILLPRHQGRIRSVSERQVPEQPRHPAQPALPGFSGISLCCFQKR